MTPASLGRAIRARLEARGMSQTDLATGVGVKPPTVSGWLVGRFSPALPKLHRVAELLGCSVDDLLAEARAAATEEPTLVDTTAPEAA